MFRLNKHTTKELRKKLESIPGDAYIPLEYGRVYNNNHSEGLSPRACVMWFLDFIDGKPSIELPPDEIFPYIRKPSDYSGVIDITEGFRELVKSVRNSDDF